jgi:hypothetical protein
MSRRSDSAPRTEFDRTARTRVKRLGKRAVYDRDEVYGVLDAGLMCHVGYVIDGQPYVTPTAYWRDGDQVFWHGSSASRMLRQVETGIPICFTVAMMDGLVLARSGFNSSINYRSLMAFGHADKVTEPAAKLAALEKFSERLVPGRWAEQRPATTQELKATTILKMRLEEVSAKIRTGQPGDDEADYAQDIWAGVVPVHSVLGAVEDDPRLKPGTPRPDYLKDIKLG